MKTFNNFKVVLNRSVVNIIRQCEVDNIIDDLKEMIKSNSKDSEAVSKAEYQIYLLEEELAKIMRKEGNNYLKLSKAKSEFEITEKQWQEEVNKLHGKYKTACFLDQVHYSIF